MDLEMFLVSQLPYTANLGLSPEEVGRMGVMTALSWGERLRDLRDRINKKG